MKHHICEHVFGGTRVVVFIAEDGSEVRVRVMGLRTAPGESHAEEPETRPFATLLSLDGMPCNLAPMYGRAVDLDLKRHDGPINRFDPKREVR